MLKNYFKTAWRSLLSGKSFSLINIAGLSIGMAGAVLILLWLQNEVSFDKFHANRDNLYQVYGLSNSDYGHLSAIDVVSQPLGPALKQHYPEVAASARVREYDNFLLTVGNKSFTTIKGCLVDPSFLEMFSFPLVAGNKQQQLKNIYSITITEKLAKKLFNNEHALGKVIRIDSIDNFIVTGIIKDLPNNTRFDFEYLLPWDYLKKLGFANEDWMSNNTLTFIQLQPGTNAGAFDNKIKNITRTSTGKNELWTHFIFPLNKWHLYSQFVDGRPTSGRIETVRVFGIIALFILLIACINFMNLSTARSEKRAKEVGIRKVAGAGKGMLVAQFITEALLMACIGGMISLIIAQFALPAFSTLVGTKLLIPYNKGYFWLTAAGFIVFTGLLAGSYPAFYLSSFKPISIFKKQFNNNQSVITPRKVLVVLQFTFAIILIISTIIIHNQVIYAQNREKGYSNTNLIQVGFMGDIEKNYPLIKQELLQTGIATSVTKTMTDIVRGGYHAWGLRWPDEAPKDTNTTITIYSSDADLVKTTGMHLVAGRDININQYPADSFSVLLNETAVKTMGLKDPIGQLLRNPFEHINWRVVGVVKDYVQGSPYDLAPPTVIMGPGAWFNTMYIRFNPGSSTKNSLAKAEQIFKKYNAAYPFDFKFVDKQYARQFNNEERTKTMAGLFAALAIFISCLGLFGLSAYTAESRVKEIGVRKVLGASAASIVKLLSLDFIKLVGIAIVISTPVAWYGMDKWLQGYSYKTSIHIDIFVWAGLLATVIALLTVSYQSIKAALANPVKSLKAE